MNLFLNNSDQGGKGYNKPSSFGPKFLMMVVFTIVIGGMMLNFFQQGQQKPIKDGRGKSVDDESFLDGTPFDVRNPFGGEFAAAEDPDDPLTAGKEEVKGRKLESFVEKPEMLAGAAGRDRTGNVEKFGRIQEEGVVYLAHQLRSAHVAGKPPGEPVLNTAKGDKVFNELIKNPDLYRGKPVELRANIVRAEKGRRPLQVAALPSGANPLDVNRLYRSYVYDQNQKFHLVYTLEDQSEELGHMADVVLRGYFCRLYTGEVDLRRSSGKLDKGTIPLLVASGYKEMVSASPSASERISILQIAIALVLGIGCIAGIVILVVNRRSDLTYEARRRASREKGVSARGGEIAGDEASETDDGEPEEEAPADLEDKVAGDEDD
tara:strand:+ start:1159 stop:2292 length:1134 start_codon:yes stop_codon:yes gene_type:complete